MRSIITYTLSIITLSIVIILSLLISGCTKIPLNTNVSVGMNDTINTTRGLIIAQYTPMQCNVTRWDAWLANSSIRFIRAPTEIEVIEMYYGQVYNISLTDLKITNTAEAVCEACGVCSKGYYIEAKINYTDRSTFIETGWALEDTVNAFKNSK